MVIIKRDGTKEEFNADKIFNALTKAFEACGYTSVENVIRDMVSEMRFWDNITVEEIQDEVEETLYNYEYLDVARAYIICRESHKSIREYVENKRAYINNYKKASNTANATIDDNSNVSSKNIGVLNAEIHKSDNIEISRRMIVSKLRELFPDFNAKEYLNDLKHHIIYKHDESSFAGAIAPYCVSMTMYPFLLHGIKQIGGLSAAPKNLDSYCGMYINLIFATSAMFAGAVATSEFLLYFDYFARKEWRDNYYQKYDVIITRDHCNRTKTIKQQIHQHFQQVVYSINQPAAARGLQSAFINFSYFDKSFFKGMFGDFYFPDGTQPIWESLSWLQQDFMQWFNAERLKCILTFPVESFALVYKNGEFEDKESAEFVAQEYARGHSFFTYISDTVDSLSSCCRLKNMITTKEFSFTNGNMGVQTGSKSVITLNLNRIVQDWCKSIGGIPTVGNQYDSLRLYLNDILERVYKYHIAYNELLWDMYDAGLLPVYKAGFIDLNKQYLTIGINGLNQAAEYLNIQCTNNQEYKDFCKELFTIIKEANTKANGIFNNHKLTFNTECVPSESLAAKNYNWDKEDG